MVLQRWVWQEALAPYLLSCSQRHTLLYPILPRHTLFCPLNDATLAIPLHSCLMSSFINYDYLLKGSRLSVLLNHGEEISASRKLYTFSTIVSQNSARISSKRVSRHIKLKLESNLRNKVQALTRLRCLPYLKSFQNELSFSKGYRSKTRPRSL